VTNKGEAPGQVDEVATLLPSGRRPTCLPNNRFEPTIEQLVAENASWQKWKGVEKPTQPEQAIEACNAVPMEDVHILYISPKTSVRGTASPVEKREQSSSSG
jgi:hypothetical protein